MSNAVPKKQTFRLTTRQFRVKTFREIYLVGIDAAESSQLQGEMSLISQECSGAVNNSHRFLGNISCAGSGEATRRTCQNPLPPTAFILRIYAGSART